MIFLIVGVDRDSLTSWHESVGARDVATARRIACSHARARGINPVVVAAVAPGQVVVAEPAPPSVSAHAA
jgi:hypothetical protein